MDSWVGFIMLLFAFAVLVLACLMTTDEQGQASMLTLFRDKANQVPTS